MLRVLGFKGFRVLGFRDFAFHSFQDSRDFWQTTQCAANATFAIAMASFHTCLYVGGGQNCGPFLGTLNIRGRIIIGIQKGTVILTTTHISTADMLAVPSSGLNSQPRCRRLEEPTPLYYPPTPQRLLFDGKGLIHIHIYIYIYARANACRGGLVWGGG